jgi:thioredoxin-like negative regulator of GroEL
MKILEIKEKNKTAVTKLLSAKTPCLILFYMNGCMHCDALQPVWKKVKDSLKKQKGLEIAEVEYSSINLLPLGIRGKIAGFPTIQVISGGKAIHEYYGDRTLGSITEFAKKHIKDDKGPAKK